MLWVIYNRVHFKKVGVNHGVDDEEVGGNGHGVWSYGMAWGACANHATLGHAHGSRSGEVDKEAMELIQHRVISQIISIVS